MFQAPSRPPVPPPTDSPNDRIACRFPYPLRLDGNSIHITRQEFPEESVRAQSELRNRQPQTHTYHRAFEGRGDCAILAPTDTPDSNPAAGTIVPFGRRAIFAKGQQSCESRRDPSHASGGLRSGRQAGTCGGAGGCRDGRASVRSVESARSGLAISRSTSSQLIRRSSARLKNSPFVRGRRPVLSTRVGSASGGSTACSSTSAKCRPTSSAGKSRASAMASSNALPVTSSEALVTIPC